jgi:hypothetical protein
LPATAIQNATTWPSRWQTDVSFEAEWARTDAPVAAGLAGRSWLWGPEPFAVANEQYAQSPTGVRLVEYLDKGRMEVNNPAADRASPWFVSSGMLVREMVSGQIQVGSGEFLSREPAAIPVTGDPRSEATPTFAAFADRMGRAVDMRGQVARELMAADGSVRQIAATGDARMFAGREYDEVTGHNVPAVFVEWARREGPQYVNGVLMDAALMDPLFVLGRPITEAYWVDSMIGGQASRVLVQLFERRTLTYNPANPPEWRVEMGNVGRAYFQWRYGTSPPGPAVAARLAGSGVTIGGWNWGAGLTVRLRIDLAGADPPVSGPVTVTPDASGHFSAVLPASEALTGALASRGNLRVVAEGAAGMASLPFNADTSVTSSMLEGMLSHVERDGASVRLTMTGLDGTQLRLILRSNATVRYAEGGTAQIEAVEPGAYVAAAGTLQDNILQVARLSLLSVSGGGAVVGYKWVSDRTLRVTGRGWPAGQEVVFEFGAVEGSLTRFAALTADSRGNLVGSVTVPSLDPTLMIRTWLSARTASPLGTAGVSMPMASLGSAGATAPPLLFAYSATGGQLSAGRLQCTAPGCGPESSVVLPAQGLGVQPGEVVALRPRWGTDPLIGPSPNQFSADLFVLSGPAGGSFTPSGAPAHSSGGQPGRPLSVAIPQGVPPGEYVLLVRASWPRAGDAFVHSFLLEIR